MAGRFLARRIGRALLTILMIITFTFAVIHMTTDPVQALLGDQASQAVIDAYTQKFGLDRPLWEQYFSYLANVLQGDFGVSMSDQTTVGRLILDAIPNTLILGLTSLGLGILLGIALGIAAAFLRNTIFDRTVMGFAVFGFAMPNFFLGILLILYFSMYLRILPSAGASSWQHLILPAITLATHFAGTFARFTRSAMLEVLHAQYMLAARAKGVTLARRLVFHALPNAAIPILTIAGLKLGDMIAGAIVVETVFAWPGIGRLLVKAVEFGDLALVQGILILTAISMILVNLGVDLLYGVVDPRLRHREAAQATQPAGEHA